jgi:hypothetical protein
LSLIDNIDGAKDAEDYIMSSARFFLHLTDFWEKMKKRSRAVGKVPVFGVLKLGIWVQLRSFLMYLMLRQWLLLQAKEATISSSIGKPIIC